MTSETMIGRRSFYDAVVGDLIELVKAQPHQTLISSASVAIVASEAAALVPAPFNVLMAIGAEWAYLRGLASSPKGARGWVTALNWGALALVVLYGMLWGARKFGALPETPTGFGAWLLTGAHILPVAFLSLAAAMVHRSAVEAEAAERDARDREAAERQRKLQAEEDERLRRRQERLDEIEALRLSKLADVEAMEAATLARQRLRQASTGLSPAAVTTPVTSGVTNTVTPRPDAEDRAVLRARVVALIRDSQTSGTPLVINQAWKAAGLSSRAMWYKLVAEAEGAGELPREFQ